MPQFRPTVWPGTVVPVPTVLRPEGVRVHEHGWLELLGKETEVEVPTGFYLREVAADGATTTDDAVRFVEQWGRSADPDARDLVSGELWMSAREFEMRQTGALERHRTLGRARYELAAQLGVDGRRRLVHTVEVIERIRLMQDVTWVAIAQQQGVDLDESRWGLFLEPLNAALSAYQVRVLVEGEDRPFSLPWETAYSVAALQLYNDLATGATYRECASETCRVVYTVQRGRAEHYARTTGTKYCTNRCAKAQAERERRRRAKGSK